MGMIWLYLKTKEGFATSRFLVLALSINIMLFQLFLNFEWFGLVLMVCLSIPDLLTL